MAGQVILAVRVVRWVFVATEPSNPVTRAKVIEIVRRYSGQVLSPVESEVPRIRPRRRTVSRLATPLPKSVLDRYYAQHPEERQYEPRMTYTDDDTVGDMDSPK